MKVRFYRPKTLKMKRTPTYARTVRNERPQKDGFDKYSVILRPVATEKAMKKMEEENTMVKRIFRYSCVLSVLKRIKLRKPLSVFTTQKSAASTLWSPPKARKKLTLDSVLTVTPYPWLTKSESSDILS